MGVRGAPRPRTCSASAGRSLPAELRRWVGWRRSWSPGWRGVKQEGEERHGGGIFIFLFFFFFFLPEIDFVPPARSRRHAGSAAPVQLLHPLLSASVPEYFARCHRPQLSGLGSCLRASHRCLPRPEKFPVRFYCRPSSGYLQLCLRKNGGVLSAGRVKRGDSRGVALLPSVGAHLAARINLSSGSQKPLWSRL